MEISALGMDDKTVGDEPPEHLAGRLRGDAEVPRDLGCGHPARFVRAGRHAQSEKVFLGGAGQIAWTAASRHAIRIRDPPSMRRTGRAER